MSKQPNKDKQAAKKQENKKPDSKPRKQPTPNKKKAEKIVDIYKQSELGEVDMTKMDRKPNKKKGLIIFLVIAFLFILAGAAVAGFMIFNTDFDGTQAGKAEININSVNEIASGEKIELEIVYENKENTTINNGNITVHYPSGFYFQKANPQPNTDDNSWNIANVAAGAGGKITITGQLVGELEEEKSFNAFFTYQPENFKSDFQDTANKIVRINDTIVTVQTQLQELAYSGQEIEYQINFTNTSSLPLPNVKVMVELPQGFEITSTDPTADTSDNTWKYDELASQQEESIFIKGVITGDSKQEKDFKFQLGLEEPNGFYNLQVEKTDALMIVNPNLKLNLQGPEYIVPGEEIEYNISAENTSDIAIEDIKLQLDFSPGLTEKEKITLEDIASIQPGAKKEISKKIITNKKPKAGVTGLISTLSVASAKVEGQEVKLDKTAEFESKIKAELSFETQARYYDDDLTKIGTGPVPPKVGVPTSYVIWWDINAAGGNLKDITVTTTLPDEIDGITRSSKAVEYDRNTGQVTYSLDKLPKADSKRVSFTVMITPTKDQVNKLLVLTKETVINAVDANTKETISQNIERLTSDLPNDPAASGKGVVVK